MPLLESSQLSGNFGEFVAAVESVFDFAARRSADSDTLRR